MLEVIEALAIKIYVSCTQSLPPARCPDFNRMKLEGRHNKKSTHTHTELSKLEGLLDISGEQKAFW